MKSIGSDRKSARFSKFNYMLQAAAIGGLVIAARFIFGGQAPAAAPQIAGDLGGAERYLTHVATDKPIYRTGEKLYVRGVILRADGHSPCLVLKVRPAQSPSKSRAPKATPWPPVSLRLSTAPSDFPGTFQQIRPAGNIPSASSIRRAMSRLSASSIFAPTAHRA